MTDTHDGTQAAQARADWDARIGVRRASAAATTVLDAPKQLRATDGRGNVTLDWDAVPGAIGYLVHRADAPGGPFQPLDHHGGDVLSVPHPPYADTTGEVGRTYHYAVASLADIDAVGPVSDPVAGTALAAAGGDTTHGDTAGGGTAEGDAVVRAVVDAARATGRLERPWAPMIGAEHLSHLLSEDTTGGRPIGAELAEALSIMRSEFGVEMVRAHAILCDDLGVYREVGGTVVHDFNRVDAVFDQVLSLGLRPVVELSFMPRDLASDVTTTVFGYGAIVSPPKSWQRWGDLIRDLVRHLVDRHGLEEVRRWPFEVWNEANLDVFWSGTQAEYLRLYEVTARAVKSVDETLQVGGPGSAAAAWNGDLLRHAAETGAPLDFLSTHTYGSPPLDFRPLCARYGREDLPLLWTEWGVTPTHFNRVSDGVFAATFLLRGMRSAAGRIEALAYWVASDHFEELGRPPRLFHGGFGLLTVGNLRKPRYWALEALNQLGEQEAPVELSGDGAGSLVEAWAGRDADGRVQMLVWNGTLDQSKADGASLLDRALRVEFTGLDDRPYQVSHRRIDRDHSDIRAVWEASGGGDWPDQAQWEVLRQANTFAEYEPSRVVQPTAGAVSCEFPLPMPGVSLLELTPAPSSGGGPLPGAGPVPGALE
ncbi:MAG: GH39 family glycosyl hydrolase [Micromonosporaceae bacterium]